MQNVRELFNNFYEKTDKKTLFQLLISLQTQIIGNVIGYERLSKDQTLLFAHENLGLNRLKDINSKYNNYSDGLKMNVSRETSKGKD